MIKSILIDNLLLDENNPRLEGIDNQDDALSKIIESQGSKLVNLARDIVEMGSTNPSELPIVIPSSIQSDKYTVLEGNRRLAAIRLLSNPNLIEQIQNKSLRKHFQQLRVEYLKAPIKSLMCYEPKDKVEANHWRLIRHTGAKNGIGIVRWDAGAVARFNQQLGITNYNSQALQVMDHLKITPLASASVKNNLGGIDITNLARLVNDPDVRNAIGLNVKKGIVDTNWDQEIVEKLTTVIERINTAGFNAYQIYGKEDRREFIKQVFGTQDATSQEDQKPTSTADNQNAGGQDPESSKPDKKTKKSRPLSTTRSSLIPSSTVISINHPRLNKIYRELRSLRVDEFENCAAVMLRVFLELSADEYISNNNIVITKDILYKKLQAIADYMEKKKILDSKKLKGIRVATTNKHSILSTNTLNAYVHNKDFEPSATDLKIQWNNIEDFVKKLWE